MRLFCLLAIIFIGTSSIKANDILSDRPLLQRRLAQERIQMYMRTIVSLRQTGSNHIYEAEQISVLLSDKAASCAIGTSLGALVSSLASGSPARIAFAATLYVVGGYLEGCCNRYFEIQEHLKTAQKCFEMAESLSAELARKEQDDRWLQ